MAESYTMSLHVEDREQADKVLAVLQEAEEQGELDFAFDVKVASNARGEAHRFGNPSTDGEV